MLLVLINVVVDMGEWEIDYFISKNVEKMMN